MVWLWKTKYGEKAKPRYKDTESFIVSVKTDNIYYDIAEDVETGFYKITQKKQQETYQRNERWIRRKNYENLIGLRVKTYIFI